VALELSVEQWTAMIEAGVVPEDRRVFLRDGRLYEKTAKTKSHGYVGAALNRALISRLPEGWSVWPECTVVLDARNAPLPDFSVIRGSNPLDYGAPERYPVAGDVGILIEVAVTSLRGNLTLSLGTYARAGVAVYWVVDVVGRRILVHSEPRMVGQRGEYGRVESYGPGQVVPLVLDGVEVGRVPVDEVVR
jgi:Uma2 family endonuclease